MTYPIPDVVKRKPRKIKEGSREWRKRVENVNAVYAPTLVQCKTCGSPRHEHYICLYCGKE